MEFTDSDIEQWKFKKLLKFLGNCAGSGTSLVSIYIPPNQSVSFTNQKLTDEYGTASNIKSKANKDSVLEAIRSAQQILKRWTHAPETGLAIFCGTVTLENNKEKKLNYDVVPIKVCQSSLYMCDSKFHIADLEKLLVTNEQYGFIIVDGNGALFATLNNDTKKTLTSFEVELPSKTRRGGQSALRFSRLRAEKKHLYLEKVAKQAKDLWINDTGLCTSLSGLVIAGSADIKHDLNESNLFHPELKKKVISSIDVAYGGEAGLNQAIDLSSDVLKDVKMIKEKKIISKFFNGIIDDTAVYGVKETMNALELGTVDILICWENLPMYIDTSAENPNKYTTTKVSEKSVLLTEWLAENYKTFGTKLIFVSDNSSEGKQFCTGMSGFAGLLRYKLEEPIDYSDNEFDSDSEFI